MDSDGQSALAQFGMSGGVVSDMLEDIALRLQPRGLLRPQTLRMLCLPLYAFNSSVPSNAS